MIKIDILAKQFVKNDLPAIRPGDTVRIFQKIKEGSKERLQAFEGVIIARKHGKQTGATITVRKVVSGIGIERIFPIHSPIIDRIELLQKGKARRAKLYYLRGAKGKRAKIKRMPTSARQNEIIEMNTPDTELSQMQRSEE